VYAPEAGVLLRELPAIRMAYDLVPLGHGRFLPLHWQEAPVHVRGRETVPQGA
jgi:hypothetical protein